RPVPAARSLQAVSVAGYLLGVVIVAGVVASLGFGAIRVRARLLSEWSGAPARLAEILLAVAALIMVPELLGAVGQFRRWAVTVALVVVGISPGLVARRGAPGPAA